MVFIVTGNVKSKTDLCENKIKVNTLIQSLTRNGQVNAKIIYEDFEKIVADIFKNSYV
jgi:hypothetical protein